jgi:hypothetical protein
MNSRNATAHNARYHYHALLKSSSPFIASKYLYIVFSLLPSYIFSTIAMGQKMSQNQKKGSDNPLGKSTNMKVIIRKFTQINQGKF